MKLIITPLVLISITGALAFSTSPIAIKSAELIELKFIINKTKVGPELWLLKLKQEKISSELSKIVTNSK